MANPTTDGPIIFFDGVCNLCNGLVQFIIKRDKHATLRFSSLQSEYARRVVPSQYLNDNKPETILLLTGDALLERSDAVLAIAAHLRAPWPAMKIFRIVPRAIRDAMYNIIAHNRYRWFGKRESCMIPTPELRSRFID